MPRLGSLVMRHEFSHAEQVKIETCPYRPVGGQPPGVMCWSTLAAETERRLADRKGDPLSETQPTGLRCIKLEGLDMEK